jgi:uncharacterized protein (DUF2342 family)
MISKTDFFALAGLLICALSLFAPGTIANYSRARWQQADVSTWMLQREFGSWAKKFVMKPWYPTFIRFYGLFGLVFLLIYFVFVRFSK